MIPSVSPSPELFAKIETRLSGDSAPAAVPRYQDAEILVLTQRLRTWQRIAFITTAVAASVIVAAAIATSTLTAVPRTYVAVLEKDSTSPALLVSVDLESRTLTVRPVAVTAPKGKSYELWLVNDKLGAPRSLGVLSTQGFTIKNNLTYDPNIIQQSTYAVSIEPEGGSPIGTATGLIVFRAPLLQAVP